MQWLSPEGEVYMRALPFGDVISRNFVVKTLIVLPSKAVKNYVYGKWKSNGFLYLHITYLDIQENNKLMFCV